MKTLLWDTERSPKAALAWLGAIMLAEAKIRPDIKMIAAFFIKLVLCIIIIQPLQLVKRLKILNNRADLL